MRTKLTKISTALLTAIAITLTPVAGTVAQAAPPKLYQAMVLRTPGSSHSGCTLSIADEHTAYTALHCGTGYWKVGDKVRALYHPYVIGTITALGTDVGKEREVDAVKIELTPGATIRDYVGRGDSSKLKNGDPVRFKAPGNTGRGVVTEDTPVRHPFFQPWTTPTITTNIQTFSGNSGGPLMDEQGNLLGILTGGNAKDKSWFTPLHIIEETIG